MIIFGPMNASYRPWLILIALAMLVVMGAAFFPASWALALASGPASGMQYASASGPWWRGRVSGLHWQGLDLGHAEWRLDGISGNGLPGLCWRVAAWGPDHRLSAQLESHGTRLRAARALRGTVPAGWMVPGELALLAEWRGRMELELDRILLDERSQPVYAAGTVRWIDAGLNGLWDADLGEIRLRLEERENMTAIEIDSLRAAEVTVTGRGRLAGAEFAGTLRLQARASKRDLLRLLEPFGSLQPDGALLLPFAGRLGADAP